MKPRIRIDDVLQTKNFGYWQKISCQIKPMFEWFKETVKSFESYPFILAVLGEGVDVEPEWVEYIKAHPHWEVQCHGWEHKTYTAMDTERIRKELTDARKKLETTFNCYVTKFYPPKMRYNDMTREASRQAGLMEARERWTVHHYLSGKVPDGTPEMYCHYWNPLNVEALCRVLADGF